MYVFVTYEKLGLHFVQKYFLRVFGEATSGF